MSCKTILDDIQQSSQSVENEYNVLTLNRVQELNQRFDLDITNYFVS